jgi:hypothetical protein
MVHYVVTTNQRAAQQIWWLAKKALQLEQHAGSIFAGLAGKQNCLICLHTCTQTGLPLECG